MNSSLIIQRGDCFTPHATFENGAWVPSVERDVHLWPLEALVRVEELILFTIWVMRDVSKPPGLSFSQHGGVIASYDLDDLAVPRTMVFEVPHVRGNPFGWGALVDGEMAYLYAHEEPTGTFVARTPLAELTNPDAWEFWVGTSWAPDVASAVPIANDRLRVFATGEGYRAAAIRFMDQRLHLFSSESPAGPWTLDQVISLDPIAPNTHAYAYEPLMLGMADQQAVFAVNFLPVDPSETLSDVTLYGPRFMTVDLGVAG